MNAKQRPRPSRMNRAVGEWPGQTFIFRKRRPEGWLQLRRASMQPWRRGRIRPSSCHDLKEES
jgi:hypothetical protein